MPSADFLAFFVCFMSYPWQNGNRKAITIWLTDDYGFIKYPGWDLNPYDRNGHRILSPACLPIPPPGQQEDKNPLQCEEGF